MQNVNPVDFSVLYLECYDIVFFGDLRFKCKDIQIFRYFVLNKMLVHIFFLQNVTPKKPAEETALISDIVADSPHKVTYIIGFSLLDFFKEKAVSNFQTFLVSFLL